MPQPQTQLSNENSLVSTASREDMKDQNENLKNKEDLSHEVSSSPALDAQIEKDAVEEVVRYMPVVLPLAGGVLMFLLASIAVYLA